MSAEINTESKSTLDVNELKIDSLKLDDNPGTDEPPKPEEKEKYLRRFKRFLHYASEYPVYKPGDRFYFKHFEKSNVSSLDKLVVLESPENIVNLIIKVKQDGTSVYPDSLVFALSLCSGYDKCHTLQTLAYNALKLVCPKPREFFLFVKFTKEAKLSPRSGRGWKKALINWYNVWTPFDLSQILLRHRSYFGWSHRDVFKLIHIKPRTPQQEMLLMYSARGFIKTVANFEESEDPFIKETVKYLKAWKSFSSETNLSEVIKKLEIEIHPIELIPCRMLREQAVWNVILPRLEIKDLIQVLQRLATYGFLRSNSHTSQILIDALDNYYSKQNCELHPCEVFVALREYQTGPKMCLTWEQRNHPLPPGTEAKQPPKLNPAIEKGLINLCEDLFKLLPSTNKNYMIAIDSRTKRKRFACSYCPCVDLEEACQLITKSKIASEPEESVVVVTFDSRGRIIKMPLNRTASLPNPLFDLKEYGGGKADIGRVINYASKNNLKTDVFLIISDFCKVTNGCLSTLRSYRTEMQKPDAKVINCCLTGRVPLNFDIDMDSDEVFYIFGFDSQICKVIDSVSRGAF